MLNLIIKSGETFDESTQTFHRIEKDIILRLEHSLVSISKWESKYHVSFFLQDSLKEKEKLIDYIKMMTITQNVDDEVYTLLSSDNFKEIAEYLQNPMTATTIKDIKGKTRKSQTITTELIYAWMVAANIPFSCEKWHINRLLTLIKVCNIENNDNQQKMSKNQILSQNAQINKMRRAKMHSRG